MELLANSAILIHIILSFAAFNSYLMPNKDIIIIFKFNFGNLIY